MSTEIYAKIVHAHKHLDANTSHMAFPIAEPKTLVESAYKNMRRDIIEGVLKPNEKLRVEHLKDDYKVGAGTLREALSLLISDALVVSQGQRGFRVTPVSIEDFADITQSRITLEGEALRQSIQLGDDAWEGALLSAFHLLTKAEAKLESTNSREIWEECNKHFHEVLIAACPSRWLKHFISILYHQAERYRRISLCHKSPTRDLHAEHEALVKASLARDADLATNILADHINLTYVWFKSLDPKLINIPKKLIRNQEKVSTESVE